MLILRLGSCGIYFDSKLQKTRIRLSSNIQSNSDRVLLFVPQNLWPYIGGGGVPECCIGGNFPSLSVTKVKSCFLQSLTRKGERGLHVENWGTFDIRNVGTTENH